ncbi:hypothetical protein CJ214_01795 [Peptoniphilus lacrimalis]|nr:hypothetical protein CJ214_01795 [Peptoniphilus lacrimalis]
MAGPVVRALQRAHVFASVEAHRASTLSGSARQIAFSRYALSSKAGWRACEDRNTQTSRNVKWEIAQQQPIGSRSIDS